MILTLAEDPQGVNSMVPCGLIVPLFSGSSKEGVCFCQHALAADLGQIGLREFMVLHQAAQNLRPGDVRYGHMAVLYASIERAKVSAKSARGWVSCSPISSKILSRAQRHGRIPTWYEIRQRESVAECGGSLTGLFEQRGERQA